MQKLATQVIDFYDDQEGHILKKRFPTPETLPNIIKTGAFLDEEERGRIRDELYGLVIKNNDEVFRKFACTDGCNTALSVIYLLDHAKDVLPEPAVKTAAQNILSYCGMYDIKPPETLEKLAGAVPDKIEPYVDLSNVEMPVEDRASTFCLKKEAKYALDTYSDTLKAKEYFEKHAKRLHPAKRREYAINLSNRSRELGIPIDKTAQDYSANGWKTRIELADEFTKRVKLANGTQFSNEYKVLFTKVGSVAPGVFANMLMQIDETSGLSKEWDNSLQDPFSAVIEKEANSFSYTGTQGYVDEEDLNQLKGYRTLLVKAFGEDFYEEFKKNPVTVFKALPEPEKNTVIKLVAAAKKW